MAKKTDIWGSLLRGVSSNNTGPETKQILLLGGTPDLQRDLLASLSSKAPVANDYALGYSYQEVYDNEDLLARLDVHTLSKPLKQFIQLLQPLLTVETIPNTLLVLLIDWSEPWKWVEQLRDWVRMLRQLLILLPNEAKVALEENVVEWRDKKRKEANESSASTTEGARDSSFDADVTLPLGPGEWDIPLGLPLCIVAHSANKIETLEKESGWKDRQFDFAQQFIRTIALKHGGSLIYTMPHQAGSSSETAFQTLIHTSLGLQSLSKKRVLKHNTTDRDHILVPPHFDSWGKIRILTDDFNIEAVSEAWSADIEAEEKDGVAPTNSVSMYAEVITPPDADISASTTEGAAGLEVETVDIQDFLGQQMTALDELHKEDERGATMVRSSKQPATTAPEVEEHIGPVQFNLGGIQVDAEDMVKRLKDRESSRTEADSAASTSAAAAPSAAAIGKTETEQLANFFKSLAKKPGDSASNSPRRTGS